MRRNAALTKKRSDPLRTAVGLPIGHEGEYFVGAEGMAGQEHEAADVLDFNHAPGEQPGLWCQWVPDSEGKHIRWDDGEKFYDYVEWIGYLVKHFLAPWGYKLTGVVEWFGEEREDLGAIKFDSKGVMRVLSGKVTYK